MKLTAQELVKYSSHLMGVQVRWDKAGIEPVDDYVFVWKGNNSYYLGIITLRPLM
jgi:hypothetical protein